MQIGSSTFCSLRSKMCVLPGLSVTHSVCVCTHHQNMILILALLGVSLAELNEFRVCDIISKSVWFIDVQITPRTLKCYDHKVMS